MQILILKPINGNKDDQIVRHINLDIKNDYEDNPIIKSVSDEMEMEWADSLNRVALERQKIKQENKEVSIASKKKGESFDINSSHVKIRDAQILANKKPNQIDNGTSKIARSNDQSVKSIEKWTNNKELYTVQILAMFRLKPDQSYFNQVGSSEVNSAEGKDGIKRFFTGQYTSHKEALNAMRILRKAGYVDAFVRRIERYKEL